MTLLISMKAPSYKYVRAFCNNAHIEVHSETLAFCSRPSLPIISDLRKSIESLTNQSIYKTHTRRLNQKDFVHKIQTHG